MFLYAVPSDVLGGPPSCPDGPKDVVEAMKVAGKCGGAVYEVGHMAATNTSWAGPWGVSFTANLTPDVETGLGAWTVDDFKATIRGGRHMGRGRPVLPPMPIAVYDNFSDDDLEAVFAYLRTIPPVKNRVPEPEAPRAAQ